MYLLQSHFYNAQEQEIDGHPWLMPIQRWLSQPKNWVDHQPLQQEVLYARELG